MRISNTKLAKSPFNFKEEAIASYLLTSVSYNNTKWNSPNSKKESLAYKKYQAWNKTILYKNTTRAISKPLNNQFFKDYWSS